MQLKSVVYCIYCRSGLPKGNTKALASSEELVDLEASLASGGFLDIYTWSPAVICGNDATGNDERVPSRSDSGLTCLDRIVLMCVEAARHRQRGSH